MANTWTAVIGRLGTPTSDGRVILPEGFTTRPLPLPLSWQEESDEGHERSKVVGVVETITPEFDTGLIRATGTWLDPAVFDDVPEAMGLVDAKVVGPSMDAGACEYAWQCTGGGEGYYAEGQWQEPEPFSEVCVLTRYECAGVTLVSIPAFTGVSIVNGDTAPALVAAGARSAGWSSMPIADAGTAWSGSGAAGRVADWAGINSADATAADWAKYAQAFLWQDPEADPQTKGAYGLGIADVINGELTIVPKAVYAVAGVLNGARGGTSVPQAQQDKIKRTVSTIYKRLAKALDDPSITAPFSLVASGDTGCTLPRREWFSDPKLTGPTPLTITPEGRVFGHAAPWDVPHIGLPGQETAPKSRTGYAYFMLGATMTDGGEVATGKLTVGGGHADPWDGFAAAAEHYDNVGTCVATVAAGEDEFGIWVAGAVVTGATPEQVESLRQSPLSGDWRDIGGNLEAVAFHAVNTPGFPVPRARAVVAAGGRCFSLVASGRPIPVGHGPIGVPPQVDDAAMSRLADRIASRLAGITETFDTVRQLLPSVTASGAPDLRAELAAEGIDWPTITVTRGGQTFGPFEVAEGCVKGALAMDGTAVEQPADMSADAAADAIARAQARLRLLRALG